MSFNSYTFAALLAWVLLVHHAPLSWTVRKLHLLLASYLFYAAWNPPFVLLLILSTVIDWVCAHGIARSTGRGRRCYLGLSLVTNLGLLGYYKYGGFLVESLADGLAWCGVRYQPARPDIVLPVGISFYTFQTLSYTLDVYLRRAAPGRSFLDYALYVTFFPQLVAGPIVRTGEFVPQCAAPRRADARQMGWGLTLLVVGLFQKIALADGLFAPIAERVFGTPRTWSFGDAWCGTLAFAGQIFCDFAGYSACAIGVALCLGFELPDNFRCPYAAIGFSDFWRRWHISLSTWLRDYLYVPLGGNRGSTAQTVRNLLATMLIGGLWHGASWTFVAWGGVHGLLLVLERGLRRLVYRPAAGAGARAVLMGATFFCICLTWVLFRATTFDQAFALLRSLFTFGGPSPALIDRADRLIVLGALAAIVAAHAALRERPLESLADRVPWWGRSLATAAMLVAIVLSPGEDRAFIYFQF